MISDGVIIVLISVTQCYMVLCSVTVLHSVTWCYNAVLTCNV